MADHLDLSLVEKDLTRKALERIGPMGWLRQSYDVPDAFWKGLLGANGAFFTLPAKSRLHGKYDFHHDIFARNQQNPAPAFRWFQETGGWQELSYSRLERLVVREAARWVSLGAATGQILCIVSHLNERFLISLLAALKTGLIVSILPPLGFSFLRRRIDALAPDFIWAPDENTPLLAQYRGILLTEGAAGRTEPGDSRSHSYTGSRPFALCFDPSTATPDVPRELNADSAYLCAVRDGSVALGLRPGQAMAAPGFGIMETQPALLLACLLSGATYVHIEERDVARNPGLLLDRPLRAVGVTPAIREILLGSPVEVGKTWDFWFRDPAESRDIEAWTEFVEALKLRDAFSCNQRWNASLGGCILFSVRRKGSPHAHMLPAAGVPWSLADLADSERDSLSGSGWFAVRPPGMEKGGIVAGGMLAEGKNEWLFVRPVLSGRSGKFYPAAKVLEAVSGLPYGSSCSVVEAPVSRADGFSLFVLLVFVGGRRVNEALISENIRKKIVRELGKEFLPDAVQIVPLHPRRGEDGSIDHEWCTKKYLSGGLSRRARGEVYRCLAELRDLIHDYR